MEIREVLEASFEEGGFAVLLASTAEEAIKSLDTSGKEVRALVTDIDLGGDLSGWEVARHARELKPDIPVVYMTGGEVNEWSVKGVPNSILIPKPFAPSQVLTAVAQLLNIGNSPGA